MRSISNYPNVLILGEQFDSIRGGGITLTNLFSGWPRERLSVASPYFPTPETIRVASAYYLFGREEFKFPWPFSRFVRQPISGPVSDRENIPHHAMLPWGDSPTPTRKGILFRRVQNALGINGSLPYGCVSSRFLRWASTLDLDIIYAQVFSLQLIRFVADLVKLTGKPLALHQMDDWLPVLYNVGLFGRYFRYKADCLFGTLSHSAAIRLGISDAMCENYEGRYGGKWIAFHNPIDCSRFNAVTRTNWAGNRPFRLWYGGRIGWGNQNGVAEIIQAVVELRQEGFDIGLDICTFQNNEQPPLKVSGLEGIQQKPFVPNVQIPETLARADALFLPLDWDEHSLVRAKLSMPTKASEFMASGTPVLIYAPPGHALTRYAQEEGWGYVVSDHGLAALKAAIVRLSTDEALREQIGRRAMEVAARNHDAAKVCEEFRRVLCEGVAQGHDAHGGCLGHT